MASAPESKVECTSHVKFEKEDCQTELDVHESCACESDQEELLVIGAGLMRTGTTSLMEALEHLYGKPCYHMSKVFLSYKNKHIRKWLRKFANDENESEDRSSWEDIYKGHCTAVDYPTCVFYQQLLSLHPKAKVILTIRPAEEWARSCKETILSSPMFYKPSLGERTVFWLHGLCDLPDLHDIMFQRTLGSNYADMNEQELIDSFNQWNMHVRSNVATDRLLIFDAKQGWAPLCDFLGKEQPRDIPFPHANERAIIRANLDVLEKHGRWINVAGNAFIVFLVFSFLAILLVRFH